MIKILTNWRWEDLFRPMSKYLKNIEIIGLRKDKKTSYWYNSFWKTYQESKKNYNIIHSNCRQDIFFFKKRKWVKYIFESHWVHPWISLKYSLICAEKIINKILLLLLYPIFKLWFLYNIKNVDIHYVSIPGILELTKKSNKNAKWLPNPVDTKLFYKKKDRLILDGKKINIFYPTWFRSIKNSEYAFLLMIKLQKKYKNINFYFIRQSVSNFNKFKKELNILSKNIIWLDQIKRENLPFYYSADRDLVLWSFYPKKVYAILNMIEIEAMVCEAPILCCDLNEIIFEPIENIEDIAYKIIEDKKYRNWYIKRNYDYIIKIHWIDNVARIYEKDIQVLLNKW